NDAFMLTELRRGLARRMAKPSRLRAVVAGLLQSPLLDKLAATQGARNKKPRPQNSWKRDQTLEASVDALQNRLTRGDTAGLDDELRLLEAIRTTHSEPQWKTVCRAWARLAGGHRDALSRRVAVHRSAAEVLAQLP